MRRRAFRDLAGRKWIIKLDDPGTLQRADAAWPDWRRLAELRISGLYRSIDMRRHFVVFLAEVLRPQIERRRMTTEQFHEAIDQATWLTAFNRFVDAFCDLNEWIEKNPAAWAAMNKPIHTK